MLARLQQCTTLGLLAAALAWAAVFLARGQPVWAGVGALLIVLGYTLFLALEFVLLSRLNRDDPAPRASAAQLFGAWWGEVLAAPQVFCWRQPFRSKAEPDHLPALPAGRRGVVFVHGFLCNRGIWNPWLARLRALGVPFVAVNLEPVFGPIEGYAASVERAVASVEQATGVAPLLVAHSMGGLAVRAWIGAYEADARVHHVITIATPHGGTWLARFGFSINSRQMGLAHPWHRDLAAREPAARSRNFTCFYSHCDNIVVPASAGTLPGADNRHVPGKAHVQLALQETVFQAVLARLSADGEGAAAATTVALAATR